MKDITYALAFFFCTLISFGQCNYSLKMIDSYGDGWNGNTMNVSVDGTVILAGVTVPSDESELVLPFIVTDGADITTEWLGGGTFGNETSYEILDTSGSEVGSGAETSITTGTITAFCPSCIAPYALSVDSTSAVGATISWTANAGDTTWQYQLVLADETPSNTGTTTTNNPLIITGYNSNTSYDLYIRTNCADGDSTWSMVSFITNPSCGDTIFDSGGDTGNYGNNDLITTTVYADTPGDLVTFTFISFGTESCCDDLTVYDGPDINADVVGVYAGSTIPDSITSSHPTGALTFVFESDFSVNDIGYEILVSCAPPPSCYPPTALTISNVSGSTADFDWTAGTGNSTWEYVIVPTGDPAPTGSGTAATVNSTQFTGLDLETTYDVYVRADCGATDGFSTWSGPVRFTTMQQTNFTVDCASGVPVNVNYCYTNNDTMFWVFTSTTGFPLSVTFNAGIIEGSYDDITIYDGLDNTGTVLFNNNTNNTNDLTGLVVESTSPSMYIEVASDDFSSCESSDFYTPWDFDVSCKSCITQTVDFNIVGDCELSQDFFIEVDVSDLGSASSVVVSDNLASAEQTVTSAGVITFGPYTAGVNVIIYTENSDDDSCVVNSGALTFLCPPAPNDCSIIYAGEDTAFCEGTSTNLTATYHLLGQDTTSYEINSQNGCPTPGITGGTPTSLDIDDTWSEVIDLGFEFCFFGDTYSQILIGSNGVLSFELENSGTGNGFSLDSGDSLPNSSNSTLTEANIFGVSHDIDPSVCGDINYVVLGASPSRQFVVNYSEVCHYGTSCNSLKSSSQIILYESSNAIDVNIYNKPSCTSWNDGLAVVGIQNIDDTIAYTPPNRNTSVWDTTDEFWRFTPSLGEPDFTIEWFDGTTSIGTGDTVTVSPTETTTYSAAITYSLCTGGTATITDEVEVGINPTPQPIPTESTVYRCSDQDDSILEVTVSNSNDIDTLTYYWSYNGNDVQAGPGNTYTVPAGSDQIGEYLVTVIDAGNCFGETTITLVEGVVPQLEDDTVFTKCVGGEVELSANVLNADLLSSDLEYIWSIDGTEVQAGPDYTYIHTAEFPLGLVEVTVVDLMSSCEGSTLIEVASGIKPQLEDDTVFTKCVGGEVELSANVLNADLLSSDLEYIWSIDGTEVQAGPDYTYIHTAEFPLGLVEVAVVDLMSSCEGSTLIEVASSIKPQLEDNTVFKKCEDGEIELYASVLNTDLLSSDLEYVWFVDGAEVQAGPDYTYTHTAGLPLGFVEVVVVDLMSSCEGSTLIEVASGIKPQLEDNTVFKKCMNEDVEISVNVLNTDLLSSDLEYVWYIDGTEVQAGPDYNFTHVSEQAFGSVEVMVVDLETMCKSSTLIEISNFVNADCVDIPQGLSPNGDGMNDCLVLDHLEASDDIVKAEIYNRYGVKVFELNDYTSQWCGQDASSGNSNSNDLLPVGTYFYVIQFNSGRAPITSWIYLNY